MATAEGGAVMRRLIDETGGDAGDVFLSRLFRDVGPLPESDVARLRVRRAVLERTSGLAARRAPSGARLRMALAACALLVIGGIAGATVGRAAWERIVRPDSPVPPPVPAAPNAASRANARHAAAPVAGPVAIEATPAAAPTVPAVAPVPAAQAPAVVPAPAARKRAAVNDATLDDASNPTVLAATAMREIRRNPARARVLAEDYLAREPNGMVAEEMQYVLVAAAAALGDTDAAQLAARYHARFPSGRLVEQVRAIEAQLAAGAGQ